MNRGATYFRSLPRYAEMTGEQKNEVDTIGASLVILTLENIKMWAQWVPTNVNGSESIFKKSYDSLIERGVTFPTNMSYYKMNDTERYEFKYPDSIRSTRSSSSKTRQFHSDQKWR